MDPEGGRFETMRRHGGAGRARLGVRDGADDVVDWDAALDELPQLAEKLAAPGVEAGRYDLVVDLSNLEGHPRVDRARDRARPGTGVRPTTRGRPSPRDNQLATYGSPLMHVTGDRTAVHGWRRSVRRRRGRSPAMGHRPRRHLGRVSARSADGPADVRDPGHQPVQRRARGLPGHVAVQRMANVSLQPAEGGPTTEDHRSGRPRNLCGRRQVLVH